MCSLCADFADGPHWTQEVVPPGGERARHQAECRRYARALLATRGLTVTAWQGRFVLGNSRGRSVIVDDLAACWSAAETLAGRPVDPLERGAAEALRRAAGA
jgi:hypothetical protein